jgi:hypothetical protein
LVIHLLLPHAIEYWANVADAMLIGKALGGSKPAQGLATKHTIQRFERVRLRATFRGIDTIEIAKTRRAVSLFVAMSGDIGCCGVRCRAVVHDERVDDKRVV